MEAAISNKQVQIYTLVHLCIDVSMHLHLEITVKCHASLLTDLHDQLSWAKTIGDTGLIC